MFVKTTRVAISLALVISAAPAALAKNHNPRQDRAEVTGTWTNRYQSFATAKFAGRGQCWVPERDMGDEFDSDTRGLGHWGSCNEKGAVPMK
jgi:hypothetical protein